VVGKRIDAFLSDDDDLLQLGSGLQNLIDLDRSRQKRRMRCDDVRQIEILGNVNAHDPRFLSLLKAGKLEDERLEN
jgi:hypothetical protein